MSCAQTVTSFKPPVFTKSILIIVGGYGSGKSEVSVNLARYLVTHLSPPEPVSIADLDIVNPYFRSREASVELEKLGIRAITPKGAHFFADLPIIVPEIKGAVEEHAGKVILDVGGDDVGARVLSSLADAFERGTYDLLLVLNANRPFTSTIEGCIKIIQEIEDASRLCFTGIISNTHLLEYTSSETVLSGLDFSREVSASADLPISFVSATAQVLKLIDPKLIDVPVLPLHRSLLKPWEHKDADRQDT
ncbi:MAG TPA: cobalamin biosynthesis protein CbiA [candidate division Zixibacteria bacterium]|nr:cobalamin biosynthesis protein CbiA [candidate division Zixibacteria bacterium]